MSTRAVVTALIATALTAIVVLVVEYARLQSAEADLAAFRGRFEQVAGDARIIVALRAQQEQVATAERPKQDVYALIALAVDTAGLPPSSFADLRNESDTPLRASPLTGNPVDRAQSSYRVQSMAFNLKGLGTNELGAFLESWANVQSIWTLTRLSLTKSATNRTSNREDEGRYDVQLIISAVYLGA